MKTSFWDTEIELDEQEALLFEHFLALFMAKNAELNLSAIREEDDIILKHFIDSIYLNVFIELHWKVLDIGTGGWFPLIPLAITNPTVDFTGIDSTWKKVVAVNEFIEELWLTNVWAKQERAETLGQSALYRESFDFVVSRATAFLPTLLEYAIPLLKVGGTFIAYKLDDKKELTSAKKAMSRLSCKIEVVKNYTIGDQARTLVFITKLQETHKKFPRSVGVPSSKPLI